ncbi:MAG: hypothetical protein AAF358_04570 [Pseudomonadota bacterium]
MKILKVFVLILFALAFLPLSASEPKNWEFELNTAQVKLVSDGADRKTPGKIKKPKSIIGNKFELSFVGQLPDIEGFQKALPVLFKFNASILVDDVVQITDTGFHAAVLDWQSGQIEMSDLEGSWTIDIAQEHMNVLHPTARFSADSSDLHFQIPAVLSHAETGKFAHALLVFGTSVDGDGVGLVAHDFFSISPASNKNGAIQSDILLSELFTSQPTGSPSPRLETFSPAVVSLTSPSNSLGSVGSKQLIEKHLCSESYGLPSCGETEEGVGAFPLFFSGYSDDGLKKPSPWTLDLVASPGPSSTSTDKTIVNYVASVRGLLSVGEGIFSPQIANVGKSRSRIRYIPSEKLLLVNLFVSVPAGPSSNAMFEIATECREDNEIYKCGGVWVKDSVGYDGRPRGDVSVLALSESMANQETSSKLLQETKALIVDSGCDDFCPNCQEFAHGNCKNPPTQSTLCPIAQGSGCQTAVLDPNKPYCCAGSFRSGCSSCEDDSVFICFGFSSATDTISISADTRSTSKSKFSRSTELEECEQLVLKSPRQYESGLTAVASDWTLFGTRNGQAAVEGTSRTAHAINRSKCLGLTGDEKVLVVDHIPHIMNGREIPLPEVSLASSERWVNAGTTVARIEFDDQGKFHRSELIYREGNRDLSSQELLKLVKQNLVLDYKTARRHALSIYAVVSKDRAEFLATTPKCCPGCPPAPAVCE